MPICSRVLRATICLILLSMTSFYFLFQWHSAHDDYVPVSPANAKLREVSDNGLVLLVPPHGDAADKGDKESAGNASRFKLGKNTDASDRETEKRSAHSTEQDMVRIIHQQYKTADPEKFPYLTWVAFQQRWKQLHEGWEHRMWTDAEEEDLIARELPEMLSAFRSINRSCNAISYIMRADIATHSILYVYGGVYADMDSVPVKSIPEFMQQSRRLASNHVSVVLPAQKRPYTVDNDLMIATRAKHPFFYACLQSIRGFIERHREFACSFNPPPHGMTDSLEPYFPLLWFGASRRLLMCNAAWDGNSMDFEQIARWEMLLDSVARGVARHASKKGRSFEKLADPFYELRGQLFDTRVRGSDVIIVESVGKGLGSKSSTEEKCAGECAKVTDGNKQDVIDCMAKEATEQARSSKHARHFKEKELSFVLFDGADSSWEESDAKRKSRRAACKKEEEFSLQPPAATAKPKRYWIDYGCDHPGNKSREPLVIRGRFALASEAVAGARCCKDSECVTPGTCPQYLTYQAASDLCPRGTHLCTRLELLSGVCCRRGGDCDTNYVWTSTPEALLPKTHGQTSADYVDYAHGADTFVEQFADCVLSPNCRIIYWHVQKSGGTSIESTMAKAFGQQHRDSCCWNPVMSKFRSWRDKYCEQKFGVYEVDGDQIEEVLQQCIARRSRKDRTVLLITYREPVARVVSLINHHCNTEGAGERLRENCGRCNYTEDEDFWNNYFTGSNEIYKGIDRVLRTSLATLYKTPTLVPELRLTILGIDMLDLDALFSAVQQKIPHMNFQLLRDNSASTVETKVCSFPITSEILQQLTLSTTVYRRLLLGNVYNEPCKQPAKAH